MSRELPVSIRVADVAEHARARAAYEAWGYFGGVRPEDTVFLAERGGELVGVVRLTLEEGTRMLRGMQVAPAAQRQRIGSRLLAALVSQLAGEACFCVPYAHLVGFYGQGGFVEWPLDETPAFLTRRIAAYRSEGLAMTLMRRPGEAEGGAPAPGAPGRARA
jgi:GNAT superfamily N-acetyltransferase